MNSHHGFGVRWIGWVVALPAFFLMGSAGGAGVGGAAASTTSQAANVGDTLTIAISAAPNFNPYLADTNPYNQWALSLVYAPLIKRKSDLSYTGGLAKSYRYTDAHNKIFEMRLRPRLRFADGTPLNARAVVASLRYFIKAGINAKTWGGTIKSVRATGPLTVRVVNKAPNPEMPFVFSQASQSGHIISRAGLANVERLGQRSYGAGAYVLDASQTVPNSRYVFTPNRNYRDQSSIHWKKIVMLLIPDPSASVKAIQAGQVDYTGSAVNLLPEVQAANLPYYTAPAGVVGISIADRDGVVAPPLKDVRVRQALNYAIDRQAIIRALFAGHGTPTTQLNSPRWEGYNQAVNDLYPYDVAKAKQLLAAAGYRNGFSAKMVVFSFLGMGVLAQAVSDQWKQIGVTVDLKVEPTIPAALQDYMTRQYPLTGLAVLNSPAYLLSASFLLPVANPWNPFATSDAQMASLLAKAAGTRSARKRSTIYRQAIARMVRLAWFAPVATIEGVAVANTKIKGWRTPYLDVLRIQPAS